MFYSQTFLARKGPLSTVWIAAHLQHRLKKSHYTSTDIPSTVLRIMDPGVPIALRMSGHLLFGVVRIYSKKVDYLYKDCNDVLTVLRKAFATIQLDLTEDVGRAPLQYINLPETFDLDAVNMDYQIDHMGDEDLHLRNPEDITLTDRIPVTADHYVAISFDEDIRMDSSHTEVLPDYGAVPMEEDIIPPSSNVLEAEDHDPSTQRQSPINQHTGELDPGVHSPPQTTQVGSIEYRRDPNNDYNFGPSTQRESSTIQLTGGLGASVQSPPQPTQVKPTECRRDPNNDYNAEKSPLFANLEDNDAESNRGLDQIRNQNDHAFEMIGEMETEGMAAPSQQHVGPLTPVNSQGGTSDAQAHVGNISPINFRVGTSPIQHPQRKGRKRKQFFDEPIVLTNRFMRSALNNPCDIRRKRRDVPSSDLGTWKLNNSRRKEHIFYQPLLTGVGKDLLDIFKSEYVRSRPHLVISEEDHADARMTEALSPNNPTPEEPIAATNQTSEEPPAATSPVISVGMEIEHSRNVAVTLQSTVPAHNVVEGDYRSPDGRDAMATDSPHNISVASLGTNIASERMQTSPDLEVSPGAHGLGFMQTPDSDADHLVNSTETEDLGFLTMDNNTPASSQGTSGSIKLSKRTWHAAQYLQGLSSITPILEEPAEDLSLNKILKGKTRHIAARMFFEVLVLKTNELVDVQQEEPYGDVSLKLAPTISNAQS